MIMRKTKFGSTQKVKDEEMVDTMLEALERRDAGLDKLFGAYQHNVVEDPDIALRKDPKFYERIARDPQVTSNMLIRETATATLNWHLEPADPSNKDAVVIAELSEKRVRKIPHLFKLFRRSLRAILKGMSIVELLWNFNRETAEFTVNKHFPVSKDRIAVLPNGEYRLRTQHSPNYGKKLPPFKYIVHLHDIEDATWREPYDTTRLYHGRGLADRLYYIIYFKNNALRFLLRALERHSNPQKIFYIPPGHKMNLETVAKASENDVTMFLPAEKGKAGTPGIDVDVLDLKGGGYPVFQTFIDEYCDRHITKVILGQTLTTDVPDVGSYSLGNVHQDTFNKLVYWDETALSETLTDSLIKYDVMLNHPTLPRSLYPRFKFDYVDISDIAGFLETVQTAIGLGLNVSENQFRQVTGIKKPDPLDPEDALNMARPAMLQALLAEELGVPGEEEEGSGGSNNNR